MKYQNASMKDKNDNKQMEQSKHSRSKSSGLNPQQNGNNQ